MIKSKVLKSVLTTFFIMVSIGLFANQTVSIFSSRDSQMISFALNDLRDVLHQRNYNVRQTEQSKADFIFITEPDLAGVNFRNIKYPQFDFKLVSEGFVITLDNDRRVWVIGADEPGLMYGTLELTEKIKLFGLDGIDSANQNPYMEMRGTKFNIPLDVRTPSYSDAGDAAQNNMEEMWNIDFWKAYIDDMARYRYNFISLWSLHPFPSMVKVPKYEEVALDDIHRSTTDWKENYHLVGVDFDHPEIVNNYEIVKKITIEEKIEFWKDVMAYAKDHNVTFYIVTWNIFVNGTDGKYGITNNYQNETTRDYFKESVKALFRTYPDLGGIGITAGENMPGIALNDREDWIYDTYARGLLEVAEEMPEREFKFIHRQHQADTKMIEEKFEDLIDKQNIDFIYSFKYAKAHVMSAVQQPYHEDFITYIGDLKTIWTLRNDSNYYFRWGAPDFVRSFIRNIPQGVSQGMYYGSDGWIWGREFTTKNVKGPRQLEVKKHWYHWLLWGRLSYNPDIENERFKGIIQNRFREIDAERLFTAWQEASYIYPVTTGFHWGDVDFKWYIEGCRSRPPKTSFNESGFHDVNTFIKYPVHKYSGCMTIPNFVKTIINNETTDLATPFQVSQKLHNHSDKALEIIKQLDYHGKNIELTRTLVDIRSMALLGKYYGYKIAGATNVALYRETKNKTYQEEAVVQLEKALSAWKSYVKTAMSQNINPIWTTRVGYVDWEKTTEQVKKDIEIAMED